MTPKPKARIYLFHGNDSQASLTELRRWQQVFRDKYGEVTQVVIQADELSADQAKEELGRAIGTRTLFREPLFLVVKRLSSLAPAAQKNLLTLVGEQVPHLDDTVTLVIWEDGQLPATQPIVKWAEEHQLKSQVTVKLFSIVSDQELLKTVLKELQISLDRPTIPFLLDFLRDVERKQRIAGKVRSQEVLKRDYRHWELAQLLSEASLLQPEGLVKLETLQRVVATVTAVSPFEIVNAFGRSEWHKVRQLEAGWTGDEGAYFGLWSLLRNFWRPRAERGDEFAQYIMQRLAEVEIISKNVTVSQAWLFALLVERCANWQKLDNQPLIDPRRIWLSHVQRVGV